MSLLDRFLLTLACLGMFIYFAHLLWPALLLAVVVFMVVGD